MKNVVAILALIVVLGVVWFVWYAPDVDEVAGPEPTTEVAVRIGKITRTTLRAYVTAYGLVAPAPAHEDQAWLTLITCRGYDEPSDSYSYRVVTRAVLTKVKAEQ